MQLKYLQFTIFRTQILSVLNLPLAASSLRKSRVALFSYSNKGMTMRELSHLLDFLMKLILANVVSIVRTVLRTILIVLNSPEPFVGQVYLLFFSSTGLISPTFKLTIHTTFTLTLSLRKKYIKILNVLNSTSS